MSRVNQTNMRPMIIFKHQGKTERDTRVSLTWMFNAIFIFNGWLIGFVKLSILIHSFNQSPANISSTILILKVDNTQLPVHDYYKTTLTIKLVFILCFGRCEGEYPMQHNKSQTKIKTVTSARASHNKKYNQTFSIVRSFMFPKNIISIDLGIFTFSLLFFF